MRVRYYKEETKIKIETLDDLWYIKSVLDVGDEIRGVSYRRVKDETKARSDKGERVRVYLGIILENIMFHRHARSLRLTGPIIESSDPQISKGSYHTIEVKVHDTISVRKVWKRWQLDRLKEAEESSQEGLVLLVSIEEGEAEFAVLRRFGVDYTLTIATTISGKEEEKDYLSTTREFYADVARKIIETRAREGITSTILCGPGFAKEKVLKILNEKRIKDLFVEPSGCGGRPGIQEVLKRGAVEKVLGENKAAVETRLVEEVFSRIAKDSPAIYGSVEVQNAAKIGAVETLLLTYTYLQKHNPDRLIETVKQHRGEVHVVSPDHDAGERLDAIGGIAALLRFPVS